MQPDKLDMMAQLQNEVGQAILRQAEGLSSDLWLLAEAGDGWVGEALFKIGADTLEWLDGSSDLGDSIMALWEAEDPDKKWVAMEYEIHGTDFKIHYWYEGELPRDELGFEPREELIRRRFGNLRVIYPPWPAE